MFLPPWPVSVKTRKRLADRETGTKNTCQTIVEYERAFRLKKRSD